ncbi:hypothetical protein [Burkholderia metallica]|uniref:hypothetical protein n=1 Tax=Burkholderia metallica TaxID=488729 RepID=UPI001ABB1A3E|nr:hypothetical protein [Burkholderia metallica]
MFSSDPSKRIDGDESLPVVVHRASNSRRTGYGGAGKERTLYVPERRGARAVPRFSLPVLRCVDSVSLDTDGGAQSPYPAIAPRDASRLSFRERHVRRGRGSALTPSCRGTMAVRIRIACVSTIRAHGERHVVTRFQVPSRPAGNGPRNSLGRTLHVLRRRAR